MDFILLGEGGARKHDPEYWKERLDYWTKAANNPKNSKHLQEVYKKCADGYQRLINGTVSYQV